MAEVKDVRRLVHYMFLPPKLLHSADDKSYLFLVHATLKVLTKWQAAHDHERQSFDRAIASLRSITSIHALTDERIDLTRTVTRQD
jgi:hypothetical protein